MGLVALLVAGGAAEVLPVSLNCPLHFEEPTPLHQFVVFVFLQ
jgi:hypothetical protein